VTVTPELPQLLPGESYQCLFTDSNGSLLFFTDATVQIPNTVYGCNLTGRVPNIEEISLGRFNQVCMVVTI